jgi:3'(2'), 5'-bisphosphate nucleotidase
LAAGQAIRTLYHQADALAIEKKHDGSPVTIADQQADDFICQALTPLLPSVGLISEESVERVPFATRQAWSCYWLVDPLDGTKEFIERTGEYSVNIALVDQQDSVLGVVYAPESGDLYYAVQGAGAFKLSGLLNLPTPLSSLTDQAWLTVMAQAVPIQTHRLMPCSTHTAVHRPMTVAVSRRHGHSTAKFLAELSKSGATERIIMGSALKTCLVAEGRADVYPRFGPTSLWDTAAAQCVLEAAGGAVLNAAGHSLKYVQTQSLLNPFFMAVGDADYAWPKFPEVF